MNSSEPIVAFIPDRARVVRAVRLFMRMFMVMTIALALAACAMRPTHKPAPVPTKPAPVVAAPAPEPEPAFAVLDPGSYEQDRSRIKQTLAKNERDALPAADVGYYLDVLQGRLRQIVGKDVSVMRQGNRIALDLSRRVGFEPAGPQLGPGTPEFLAPLCKVLVEYRMVLVSIRVSPLDDASIANPRLADQRALALARQLADAGVANKRIVIAGTGGRSSSTARFRVELQLDPIIRAAAEH